MAKSLAKTKIKDLLTSDQIIQLIESVFVIPKYGTSHLVDFKLNSPQKSLITGLHDRNIILKARKEGFTTVIEALTLILCDAFPGMNAAFLADNEPNTLEIFEKTKNLIKRSKYNFGCDPEKRKIEFANGSRITISTAGRKSAGRGADLHIVHFSEVATFEYPDVYEAVLEACPKNALVFLESTANGRGLYYDLWEKAYSGFPKSFDFKPFFFGWNEHPENCLEIDGDFKKTPEEQDLATEFALTDEQIAWRRWKLNSMPNPDKFPQEHPISPSEAFISSGKPVFSLKSLDLMKNSSRDYRLGDLNYNTYKEIIFVDHPKGGAWSIFRMPEPGKNYVLGADCAEGLEGGDYNAAAVFDPITREQVAEYHASCDPDQFAYELNKGGLFYNRALIAPERNNHGYTVVNALVNDYSYPNLFQERDEQDTMRTEGTEKMGFRTTMKTRPIMVDMAKMAIRKGLIKLNSINLINECASFVVTKTGKAMHDSGKHDDRVFAMMIALYVMEKYPYIQEQNLTNDEERYYSQAQRGLIKPKKKTSLGGY